MNFTEQTELTERRTDRLFGIIRRAYESVAYLVTKGGWPEVAPSFRWPCQWFIFVALSWENCNRDGVLGTASIVLQSTLKHSAGLARA